MKKLALLLLLASPVLADGPQFVGPDSGKVYSEFQNVYGDIKNSKSVSAKTTRLQTQSINSTFIGMGRNRIINGDFMIDQRFESSSQTVAVAHTFSADRFSGSNTDASSKWTMQRSSDTTTSVGPFTWFMRMKVQTANATPGAAVISCLEQKIEGPNIRDMSFGTSSATVITLSFWARSSVTGIFGGAYRNSDSSARSYPFIYQIKNANTWTKITLTSRADTTGTWFTGVGQDGLDVFWDVGGGSGNIAASGAWYGATYRGASDVTQQLIKNASATLDITGVQLEIGERATEFEFLQAHEAYERCWRYYQKSYEEGIAPGTNTTALGGDGGSVIATAVATGANQVQSGYIPFRVQLVARPTVIVYTDTGTRGSWSWTNSAGVAETVVTSGSAVKWGIQFFMNNDSTHPFGVGHYAVDAEL